MIIIDIIMLPDFKGRKGINALKKGKPKTKIIAISNGIYSSALDFKKLLGIDFILNGSDSQDNLLATVEKCIC